jgi:hypothetical protein
LGAKASVDRLGDVNNPIAATATAETRMVQVI